MAARRASRHRVRTSAIKTFQHGGDQIAQRPQQAAPGGLHHAAARAESDRPAAPARDDTVVADVATAKTHRAAAELLDANPLWLALETAELAGAALAPGL